MDCTPLSGLPGYPGETHIFWIKAPKPCEPSGVSMSPTLFVFSLVQIVLAQSVPLQSAPISRTRPAPQGATDWESFLGPTGNGVSPEKGLPEYKGLVRLPVVWTRPLGEGYAPPAISQGRLFLSERVGNSMRVFAVNAETGKELWSHEYKTLYQDKYGYDGGARACPVVKGGRVFHLGPEGVLCALNVETGKELWSVDTRKEFGVVQNFFGAGSAPLVISDDKGEKVIVQVGGSPPGSTDDDFAGLKGNGSGVVAFEAATGKMVWKSTDGLASYSSPVVATLPGFTGSQVLMLARQGLYGIEASSGKEQFHFPWRADNLESVNAANPIVSGDKILLTECYGPGGVLLQLKDGKPGIVWSDNDRGRNKALQVHWSTPILRDGVVYASSGRHEGNAELRAVDFATGKVLWRRPGLGRTSFLSVEDKLLVLGERGNLHLIRANKAEFDELAWLDPIDSATKVPLLRYPAWAAPVLSHGLLYVRGRDSLVCLELIPGIK
jgi:outer membrane protein assembly factor BamB